MIKFGFNAIGDDHMIKWLQEYDPDEQKWRRYIDHTTFQQMITIIDKDLQMLFKLTFFR